MGEDLNGSSQDRIQLNDGAAWESLGPGHYVVFLSDTRTEITLDESGGAASGQTLIPVFESLAQAETYAEQVVSRSPHVAASIYDHHGRAGDPIRQLHHESVRHRFDPVRHARIETWVGGSFLFAFTAWAVVANRSEEHFLWFYILGVKLFVLGTVLFVRGVSHLWQRKAGQRTHV